VPPHRGEPLFAAVPARHAGLNHAALVYDLILLPEASHDISPLDALRAARVGL
jgi:hypothetical protein